MGVPILGFVGTGMMGQTAHLANYARLRDVGKCEIAGVVDLKRRLAEAVATAYRIPQVYGDVEELLADSRIQAVICVQQWPNNYRLVKEILRAGKSVLTEKPMVGRLDEAQELAALARQRGLLYAVGFMKRYDTGVELAKQLIDQFRQSGELGPLHAIDALCNGGDWRHNEGGHIVVDDPTPVPPPVPVYPDGCRSPRQREAYGYLVNIFSHNINLCHHLLGAELEPHSACFKGRLALVATARCGDVLATVRGASSAAHEWREWTTLTFARGELRIKTPTPLNRQRVAEVTLLRERDGRFETARYHAPVSWSFYRQAEGFLRALSGEEPLRAPAETCVWDVRVMERLIEIGEVR
ncbi:MAG: Gfo/Idh/MocA family oxidoreductase [Chloroflexi bacterium]|nr:Gfo/Idh/MocA family oxidoreductase [Chloroflexota bacterium]